MSDQNKPRFAAADDSATPLHLVEAEGWEGFRDGLTKAQAKWAKVQKFSAKLGQAVTFPSDDGSVAFAVIGLGAPKGRARSRFGAVGARKSLPPGTYAITGEVDPALRDEFALGWLLSDYSFEDYVKPGKRRVFLVAPEGVDAPRLETIAAGEFLTRDLINIPSNDMGPSELEGAARRLAEESGAEISVTLDEALLEGNFPMIHAVGRASDRRPRLIDMRWGTSGPQLTLVGKGVCFDTGGLNLKPGASMGLMKKDMGGAANVLGLAQMIMELGLPIRLRVLIPAVENAVSANAFRPGDILTSRKGLTVEINNTDAEGRLVLADALALADEDTPDLIISMATLTGAARVAVGADLAPYYATVPADADAIRAAAPRVHDPVWEMPFWAPYEGMLNPGIADLDNAPKGGFAGSITAALFLKRFVTETPRYVHFDIYGWNPSSAPGRPKGGIGQGTRALLEALPGMLGL